MNHLHDTLKQYYDIKLDPEGKENVKINLDWDYSNKTVHLSMAPYLEKALRQFNNVIPTKRQQSPNPHVKPNYGAKQKFAEYDELNPVNNEKKKQIQKFTGKFLWYGRGVDGTILTPLSAITAKQSKQSSIQWN